MLNQNVFMTERYKYELGSRLTASKPTLPSLKVMGTAALTVFLHTSQPQPRSQLNWFSSSV